MSKTESQNDLAGILAEALNISTERASRLLESKSTRVMRYKDIRYIALRRDVADHYEGTVILITRDDYRVVEGYPHIERVLLLSRALPRHFIDYIIVEEKMDGHNVRVVRLDGEILAITRGGYICPYTTNRMRRTYGGKINSLFDDLGENAVIAGEVVGMENPYTRYYYPEAPYWDYFIFDIYDDGGNPLPVDERRMLVDKHGLRNVPLLGRIYKENWQDLMEIVRGLESAGREGVVLKDPEYRVPPLKYTTSYINTRDIQEGMKYPFDEGHTFIFPRVLRQMFKAFEEDWSEERLREEARRLGEAILLPAIESIRKFAVGEPLAEEFILEFSDLTDLEEYISYAASLGVPITVISIDKTDSTIKARMLKHKRTPEYYKRIFKTGISPLD
ncbi:MAG: RNA ligase [Desulfurococcales archaeon]|nr:RNA ligase [Desulfurococcales archaeon]